MRSFFFWVDQSGFMSEQGSLHSMRSHFNPSVRSTGSSRRDEWAQRPSAHIPLHRQYGETWKPWIMVLICQHNRTRKRKTRKRKIFYFILFYFIINARINTMQSTLTRAQPIMDRPIFGNDLMLIKLDLIQGVMHWQLDNTPWVCTTGFNIYYDIWQLVPLRVCSARAFYLVLLIFTNLGHFRRHPGSAAQEGSSGSPSFHETSPTLNWLIFFQCLLTSQFQVVINAGDEECSGILSLCHGAPQLYKRHERSKAMWMWD